MCMWAFASRRLFTVCGLADVHDGITEFAWNPSSADTIDTTQLPASEGTAGGRYYVLADSLHRVRSGRTNNLVRTVISLRVLLPVTTSGLPAASWSVRTVLRHLFVHAPAG